MWTHRFFAVIACSLAHYQHNLTDLHVQMYMYPHGLLNFDLSLSLSPLQVSWQGNDMDGNMNFYSVSSDGRVVLWKLVKNELQYQDAVQLKIPGASVDGPEGIQQPALSEFM